MNKNLKECGHSLARSSISMRAKAFIVDIQSDHQGMIVKKGWREAMKQEA